MLNDYWLTGWLNAEAFLLADAGATVDLRRNFETWQVYRYVYVGGDPNDGSLVSHVEHIQLMFPSLRRNRTLTAAEQTTRTRLVEMWSNFVKNG